MIFYMAQSKRALKSVAELPSDQDEVERPQYKMSLMVCLHKKAQYNESVGWIFFHHDESQKCDQKLTMIFIYLGNAISNSSATCFFYK